MGVTGGGALSSPLVMPTLYKAPVSTGAFRFIYPLDNSQPSSVHSSVVNVVSGGIETALCVRRLEAHTVENRDALVEQLQLIGLTQYESDVYITLLSRPTFTASQVATQSGVPRQRVYDVLERLCARGLATELLDRNVRTFAGVEPDIALSSWLDHERREMEESLSQRTAHVQDLLPDLAQRFTAARDVETPTNMIEQFGDIKLLSRRVEDALNAAAGTFDRMIPSPFLVPLEDQLHQIDTARTNNIQVRALYERTATDDRGVLAYLQLFRENGAQIRLIETLPTLLYIVDTTYVWTVLSPAPPADDGHTVLVVTERNYAALLRGAFEHVWQQATPL